MASEEQIILRAFLKNRDDFDKFGIYVIGLKNLERNMKLMLGFIKKFYEKYPDTNTIPESELRLFLGAYDTMNFAKNNTQYVSDIYGVSLANRSLTMDLMEGCVERHMMSKVVDKAVAVLDSNHRGVLSTIQDDIDKYHQLIRTPPQDMAEYKLNLKELIKSEITEMGIPFVNNTPNNIIRGMRTGQLGLIYAYVDTGKTSYGVSNLCSVAQHLHAIQSERSVVYACNEEDVSRVSLRAIQCMTNWDDKDIEKNQTLVKAIIRKKGFDHIKFIDHVNNLRIVEKILTKYNPRVIFIDQGTKVKNFSNAEGVDALEETFNQYRDMAKRYKTTIICMAQGGESCFEKQYPQLNDIYGSKSAIQGELDWAIAIGVDTTDDRYKSYRHFNISKNKGDKGTYACKFDHKRCQFKEIV